MHCHLSDYQTVRLDFHSETRKGVGKTLWWDNPDYKVYTGFTASGTCNQYVGLPDSRSHQYKGQTELYTSKVQIGTGNNKSYIHCRSGSYGQNPPQLISGGTKHGHMEWICCPPGERKRYKNGEWGCP